MGYFSNGTEGMLYEEMYCDQCIHRNGPKGDTGCAVWLAHSLHNYEECNKKDSILNLLIPRTIDGISNEQCLMFSQGDAVEPPKVYTKENINPAYHDWARRKGLIK